MWSVPRPRLLHCGDGLAMTNKLAAAIGRNNSGGARVPQPGRLGHGVDLGWGAALLFGWSADGLVHLVGMMPGPEIASPPFDSAQDRRCGDGLAMTNKRLPRW